MLVIVRVVWVSWPGIRGVLVAFERRVCGTAAQTKRHSGRAKRHRVDPKRHRDLGVLLASIVEHLGGKR